MKSGKINKQQTVKNFFIFLCLFIFSAAFVQSYAGPFEIVPNGPLPQTVPLGGSVIASYIVTNKTGGQRNGNIVKYLSPIWPNVAIAPGGCGTIFNLPAKGSCILNLLISGAVNANDPVKSHHLYVCFPDGNACSGPTVPLNVTVVAPVLSSIDIAPVSATIAPGKSQQYTATGHYTSGPDQNITTSVTWNSASTPIATINSSGLATGVSVGTDNITATSGAITSNTATLTVRSFVYVTNLNGNSAYNCPVNADGTLGTCTSTATGVGLGPALIALNPASTLAYIVNAFENPSASVSSCPITAAGTLGACTQASPANAFPNGQSFGIALNPAGTFAYITHFDAGSVTFCQVNPTTGALSTCALTGGAFAQPIGITFNTAGSIAYIANNANGSVSYCQVNPTTGALSACADAAPGVFTNPQGVIIVDLPSSNTVAYVSDLAGVTTRCAVNPSGNFSTCSPMTPALNDVVGAILNVTKTFAYIASFGNSLVYQCPVDPATGTLGTCTPTGSGPAFVNPFGITIL